MSSKKAIVFSLDVIISLFVVFIIFSAAVFYINKAEEEQSSIHILRTASDIITLMDNKGAFNSINKQSIETELYSVLPVNYNMKIRLEGNFPQNKGVLETTKALPEDRFILTGKKITVTPENYFIIIKYWVWLK
ncbi:MAG: hypothetical protein KAU20_04555 [Nanoarchaeota archaeon]|nr:hypothetical protein [Nanoarchaeota archaeon]